MTYTEPEHVAGMALWAPTPWSSSARCAIPTGSRRSSTATTATSTASPRADSAPSLADDVAAETFLIAFDRRRRYDLLAAERAAVAVRDRLQPDRPPPPGRGAPVPGLARAGAVDGGRRRRRTGDGRIDATAQRARLAAALVEIAERDREVLLLVAWAQLSCEEAARALGIPAATARSRLHRARRKTRAALAADPRSTDR